VSRLHLGTFGTCAPKQRARTGRQWILATVHTVIGITFGTSFVWRRLGVFSVGIACTSLHLPTGDQKNRRVRMEPLSDGCAAAVRVNHRSVFSLFPFRRRRTGRHDMGLNACRGDSFRVLDGYNHQTLKNRICLSLSITALGRGRGVRSIQPFTHDDEPTRYVYCTSDICCEQAEQCRHSPLVPVRYSPFHFGGLSVTLLLPIAGSNIIQGLSVMNIEFPFPYPPEGFSSFSFS